MIPEVAQLGSVLAGDEERRSRVAPLPLLPPHPPQFRHGEPLAFIDGLAVAEPDLADPVWPFRITAVPHVFDQERACPRQCKKRLTGPFVGDVGRTHHQCRAGLSSREHMNCAQSHEGLTRTALCDDARRPCPTQILRRPSDRKCLGRQRLPQKTGDCGCNSIPGALKRRIGF